MQLNRIFNVMLTHKCWSGISGITAILSTAIAFGWRPIEANTDRSHTVPALSPPHEPDPKAIAVTYPNLSGAWILENKTNFSEYSPYKGMIVRYQLQLDDDSENIHVVGEKHEEVFEGKTTVYKGKARTSFKGTVRSLMIDGIRHLKITSAEGSLTKGQVHSELILRMISGQLLEGSFSSEAAGTKGLSTLRKIDEF